MKEEIQDGGKQKEEETLRSTIAEKYFRVMVARLG
jgi:hypothetical protein